MPVNPAQLQVGERYKLRSVQRGDLMPLPRFFVEFNQQNLPIFALPGQAQGELVLHQAYNPNEWRFYKMEEPMPPYAPGALQGPAVGPMNMNMEGGRKRRKTSRKASRKNKKASRKSKGRK